MRGMRGGIVALAIAAGTLSCTRTNPFYCGNEPNGVCIDAPTAGSDASSITARSRRGDSDRLPASANAPATSLGR